MVLNEDQFQGPCPSGPEANGQFVFILIQLHFNAIPPAFPLLSANSKRSNKKVALVDKVVGLLLSTKGKIIGFLDLSVMSTVRA